MKKLSFLFVICALFGMAGVNAQTVLDGIYVKENSPQRKVIPYTHLREADVMWSRRIWRVMDMREKINQPLYYPIEVINNRRSLTQVVFDAILQTGEITAYEDDEFKKSYTKAEILGMLNRTDTVPVENENGEIENKIVINNTEPSAVQKYRIKEDWFFDKQKSVMECRIIGMCPILQVEKAGEMVDKPLFWIYFPEARYVFANAEVFNRANDAERRTFEDIFWKRMFGSYIFKETNVYDRRIADYKSGLDALLEAERIKDDIFNVEHDLWEF